MGRMLQNNAATGKNVTITDIAKTLVTAPIGTVGAIAALTSSDIGLGGGWTKEPSFLREGRG